ncbi:unnamed protein product [Leptidea sinapis]|uniref:PID domain-containing protein n=1 Tax=Leptidea sinapis TaxID=189913 RepID=A0A5E4R3M9_9NEOP|nr:unnamed protein product [Leptidea sinapis]
MVTYDDSASVGGFHLGSREDEAYRSRAPSISSVSMYKQKIDALFDDSKSIASLHQYGASSDDRQLSRRESKSNVAQCNKKTIYEDEADYFETKIQKINSTVQDRIEKMFSDMAGESTNSIESIGIHVFNVHYLGSTPLQNKVTSLSGLQTPLKDLYFAYRRNFRHKNSLTGRLEISKSGLKVRYKGEKGDLEQLNPFPTIAVWSAVKFVVQSSGNKSNEPTYAFLPLITDPDNIDRQALFKQLESSEKKYILSNNENSLSPIFAVVMRKIGFAKQLECHGFVCQTTEDAIVIAATLYKSLMSHMSRQGQINNKKFKNRNGVSCMSTASSIPTNDVPVRPPRKKRSTSSYSGESDRADGFSASESFTEKSKQENFKNNSNLSLSSPPVVPLEAKCITVEEVKVKLDTPNQNQSNKSDKNEFSRKKLTERLSHLNGNEINSQNPQSSSESSVRSKVSEKIELFRELERRKSIQRPPILPPPIPSKPVQSQNSGKKGGGSPLGFNELFNEFKVQENLHSMDEILNAIIDPDGMSFNDLKPIYKEFLLKLAVTLTKDEIFQHSKAIMRKQKKKKLRRGNTFQIMKRRKFFKGTGALRKVFRLPFSRERKKEKKRKLQCIDVKDNNVKNKASESTVSTSSYDLRQFKPKEPPIPAPKRQTMRQRNSRRSDKGHTSKRRGKIRRGERTSSEDSDFLTLSNRLGCQNRNSSSGYVSCSECESESCIDRCYCSLKNDCQSKCYCSAIETGKDSAKARLIQKNCKDCSKQVYEGDFSYCSCDSESCEDSNKCYCAGPRRAAEQSSESLEYLQNPSQKTSGASSRRREERRRARSSDSLALDYEILLQNKPRDTRPRNMQRLTGAGSHDALSVKKSAEMAALFADVRLSQRTDVRSLAGGRRPRPPALPPSGAPPLARMFDHRPPNRNPSLEDTLGYFP